MTTDLGCAGLILIPPNDSPRPSASAVRGISSPPKVVMTLLRLTACTPISSASPTSSSSSSSSLSSSHPIATDDHSLYTPCIYEPERGSLYGSKGKNVCSSADASSSPLTHGKNGRDPELGLYSDRLLASMMEWQYTKSVACATRANCMTTFDEQI